MKKNKKALKKTESVKKILLFGFEDLRMILAVEAAARSFGAETAAVPRDCWGQTLGELAEKGPCPEAGTAGDAAGQMLVLCGLDGELDALLPALRAAGAGCVKAVLTERNRSWTAARLYRELQRERQALEGGR